MRFSMYNVLVFLGQGVRMGVAGQDQPRAEVLATHGLSPFALLELDAVVKLHDGAVGCLHVFLASRWSEHINESNT